MATEFIKSGADSYIPVGDTAGLISTSLRSTVVKTAPISSVSDLWQPFSCSHFSGENWVTGDQVKAPVAGLYLVSVAMDANTPVNISDVWLMVHTSDGVSAYTGDGITGRAAYNVSTFTSLINVASDGVLFIMQVAGPSAGQSLPAFRITIALLEQKVPYMIASKGALVSGGAFQFDSGGNCFTENYSAAEVKAGTWVDGKPLYKRTISAGAMSFGVQNGHVYTTLLVIPNTVIRNITVHSVAFSAGGSVSGYLVNSNLGVFPIYGTDASNTLRYNFNIHTDYPHILGIETFTIADFDYFKLSSAVFTIAYTKTTD